MSIRVSIDLLMHVYVCVGGGGSCVVSGKVSHSTFCTACLAYPDDLPRILLPYHSHRYRCKSSRAHNNAMRINQ